MTDPISAGEARSIAEQWVAEEVARSEGEVLCVFTWGSINWMADAEPFAPTSDLDLAVVVPKVERVRHRTCKRSYGGLTLEPFYLPREQFLSAETLLGDFALAANVVDARVLFDPERIVEGLRVAMVPQFARCHWVRQRCRARRDEALPLITAFEASDSLFHVNGVACHAVRSMAQMALIADLQNPTGKKAVVKARDVLAGYGLGEEHRRLLRLLGAAELGDEAILTASSHCRHALDEACHWLRTPFVGDNHVNVHSRLALDLDVPACVADGTGREIFPWVGSLYAHVMIAITNDAPADVATAARQVYVGDMACSGAGSLAGARAQMLACRPALERMTAICDGIVARNARVSA